MKYRTPDDMITECTDKIGRFLREGMQQHATNELKSTISTINKFHYERSITNEISNIGDILTRVRSIQAEYNIPAPFYSSTIRMLELRRDQAVDELEGLR